MTKSKELTPHVFISSTEKDLADYRRAAAEAISAAGCVPDRVEYWIPSGHRPAMDECLARAKAADAVVVIVAQKYGWEPEDQPGDAQVRKSITWLECETAAAAGKEILAFFVEAPDWPDEHKEDYEPTDARYRRTVRSIMRLFEASTADNLDLQTRIEVADVLGRAGDPRLNPDNPDRWVPIPDGSLRMDTGTGVQKVDVPGFYIARWPTTVAEYERFVEADGYKDPQWWPIGQSADVGASPKGWEAQLAHPSRPVVKISWYEAQAYCIWLTMELRREKGSGLSLKDGQRVRLPTSAEWECAAAGSAARLFPWGDQPPDGNRANFRGKLGHPTPVGIFPAGATPEGVVDMAGNVWEWCEDQIQNRRVLRGGAFGGPDFLVRCASRLHFNPGDRHHDVGFRVVLSPFL